MSWLRRRRMRNRCVKKNQYESELSILVITIMSLCVSVCNNYHLTSLCKNVNEVLNFYWVTCWKVLSLPRNLNVKVARFSVVTRWDRYIWRTFDEAWYFDYLHIKGYVMDILGRCVSLLISAFRDYILLHADLESSTRLSIFMIRTRESSTAEGSR